MWLVRESVYGLYAPTLSNREMAGLILTRLCALPCGHSTLPSGLSDWVSVLTPLSFDIGIFIFTDWKCVGGLTTRLAFNGLWPLVLMLAVALALAARKRQHARARSEALRCAAWRRLS